MLKKHSQLFQGVLFLTDTVIVGASWIVAYFLRFYTGPIPVIKGIPNINEFISILLFLLVIYAMVFRYFGLYEPMRAGTRSAEIKKILSGSVLAVFIFIVLLYLVKEYKYSRIVFIYFLCISTVSLCAFRYSLRVILGWLRRHGHNLRYVLIVGDGSLALDIEKKLTDHAEYGFKVAGFLSKDRDKIATTINDIPVLGTYGDVKSILAKTNIDQLIVALPFEHIRMLKAVLGQVYDEMVEIKIVPDLYQYFTLRKGIEILDGIPIINLRESPLYGWNRILKRLFDITAAAAILCLAAPLMLLIAVMIKLSSPGPVFYRQRRMGLDGGTFEIIKFRSMRQGAESQTGPVWATKFDTRRTAVGKFIRALNLDELPQLFNVLGGQMSMVGPRPERPEFMQEFKKRIPEYMLRHKMKAGITGWAQINGLRGDTSIEERTKYDLYYIENWSILFDLKILLRTITALKNAY